MRKRLCALCLHTYIHTQTPTIFHLNKDKNEFKKMRKQIEVPQLFLAFRYARRVQLALKNVEFSLAPRTDLIYANCPTIA